MFRLPTNLRSQLRKPLGKIVTDFNLESELDFKTICIVVGDESAISLNKHGYKIKLAVVDFQTQRRNDQKLKSDVKKIGEKVYKVTNPAGTITNELWQKIEQGLKFPSSVRIEVSGEEDLAFIPCMLLAPEDAVVVYGYPGRGMVLAHVTPSNRRSARDVLDQMIKED